MEDSLGCYGVSYGMGILLLESLIGMGYDEIKSYLF